MHAPGVVDQFGFYQAQYGWLFCGWIPVAHKLARTMPRDPLVVDVNARETTSGQAGQIAFFERGDLGENGTGVLVFIKGDSKLADGLEHITLWISNHSFRVYAAAGTSLLPGPEMAERCRGLVRSSFGGQHEQLSALLHAASFTGVSTLENLSELVRLYVDDMIVCQPDGVVLIGWMVAAPGAVKSIAICTDQGAFEVDMSSLIYTERRDVSDTIGAGLGLEESRCGFVVFVPIEIGLRHAAWLRVVTRDHEVGYMTIPSQRLRGMRAIRRILDLHGVDDGDLRRVYETVIGPACWRLNAERLAIRPKISTIQFGEPPHAPRFSLIIPLFGRIDYLEHQLAALSFASDSGQREVIYVLDDPPKRQELLALAESAYARFGVPFKVLVLGDNLGFAPASNIGLQEARGEFVCFMNSDVFPCDPDFPHHLAADLEANGDVGIVGGLLLFEDGSVQHEGMAMRPMSGGGGFAYPIHRRKGWRPREGIGMERCDMVTAACIMMRRTLAESLGGFDEGFIIGDFEDADLCERLRAAGTSVAVDHRVRLYHLERQSQVGPDQWWRSNLTRYNAWLFEQRRQGFYDTRAGQA